jgi:cysteine desulfurase / selenocysteine lyase
MPSYNLPLYRSWFPVLETQKIWLNHASISPVSVRVRAAVDDYMQNRMTGDIDVYLAAQKSVVQTKANLGRLINAEPDRIGFVGNTSEGLNVLANGIDWKSGDRIILNDCEFPTNVVPFLNCRRHGVEIDFVKSVDGRISIEDIERMITPRTRVLSISFVQFLSGYKADLPTIGRLCKNNNIIFCVDSIQGLGAAPLDVGEAQIDFLSNGGNKWLMGLMGLGFLYLTEELQSRLSQAHIGWTSNRDFFGDFFNYRIDPDPTARRYENGTQNYCAVAALEASTGTLLEVGIDAISRHLESLTHAVITMCDELGFECLTPRTPDQRAGIVSFNHPEAQRIFAELNERRVVVSMREGMLRVAPHFYNSLDDIGALRSVLARPRIAQNA